MERKFRFAKPENYGCLPLAGENSRLVEIPDVLGSNEIRYIKTIAANTGTDEPILFAMHPKRHDCLKLLLDIIPCGGVVATVVTRDGKVRYLFSSSAATHCGLQIKAAMDDVYASSMAIAMGYIITGYEGNNWILSCPLPAENQANG